MGPAAAAIQVLKWHHKQYSNRSLKVLLARPTGTCSQDIAASGMRQKSLKNKIGE
jgi:hypothetical protein